MQAEWELCKENFQPLKRGRKEVSKQEPRLCERNDAESQRRAFWKELETYTGDDPLDVWIRFIKWTQETFRAGGHQAELLPLLERCTRELQQKDKYKSDIRYLRIWIQYADCLPEPRDVFSFLKESNIGQDFALYYLAYAAYMELRGNFAKADGIFQIGLARLAHPIDRLRTKYDDFQHRMAKRLDHKEADTEEPVRSSLAVLSSHNKPRQQQQPAPVVAGSFALARSKPKAARTSGKENAGGLDIFVDDEFKPGKAEAKPESALPTYGLWNKLGGFEQNRKENIQKPSKWADQKLPQKTTLVQPAIPVLDIPVDEDIQNQPSPEQTHPVPKSMPGESAPSEPRKDLFPVQAQSKGDASALQAYIPPVAAAMQAANSASSAVGPAPQPVSLSSKKHEVSAYTTGLLAHGSGEEISFEEVRAATWFAQQAHMQKAAPDTAAANGSAARHDEHAANSIVVMALPPVNAAPSVSTITPCLLSPLNAAPSVSSQLGHRAVLCTAAGSSPDTPAMRAAPVLTSKAPSMSTEAVTKQDIAPHKAPASNLHVSRAAQQCGSPTLHTLRLPDMTANVTVATKDAFACVNAMFSSSLSHEPCHASKPASMAEPTVTISTKAAFAELNQMFSSDLPHRKQHAGSRQQSGLPRPAPRRTIGKRPPSEGPGHQRIGNTKVTVAASAVGTAQQARSVPAEETGTLGMYQDTCFLDSQKAEAGKGDRMDFAVYEDTSFFDSQSAGQQLASPDPNQATLGFQIYEDTQCIQPKADPHPEAEDSHAASPGLGIYEDTQFVNKGANVAAGQVSSPTGFGIYEDTQFLPKAGGKQSSNIQCHGKQSPEGLTVYVDTQLVNRLGRGVAEGGSGPDSLCLYEDTQFVGNGISRHAALSHELQPCVARAASEEAEDKENQAGPARPFTRDIGSPAVQAVALKPLSRQRAGQLGLNHLAQDSHQDIECVGNQKPIQAGEDDFQVLQGERHAQRTVKQHLAHQVQGLDSAMERMSPFRQRHQSIQGLQAPAVDTPFVVDPFDPDLHKSLLAGLDPPLEQWADVVISETGVELDKLKQLRRQSSKTVSLQLGGQSIVLQQKLGQGAFASVYQVAQVQSQKKLASPSSSQALKIQSPPCPWEFYICKVLQGRLPPASHSLFLSADMLYLLPGHSAMLMPVGRRGTLQDLLNAYLRKGKRMEEVVVMHYAIELLRITAALHAARVIHTDIKPDNLLLADAATATLPAWQADRPGQWSKAGLCLIDYGRAVDTALLPANTHFKGDSHTEAFRCIEMQQGQAWGWGIDAFGVCSTIHCLLFGDYMQVEKTINAEGKVGYRLKSQLKRYWATHLWQTFFDALLQPFDPSAQPPCSMLLSLFCQHLQDTPATASKLRNELIRQDSVM